MTFHSASDILCGSLSVFLHHSIYNRKLHYQFTTKIHFCQYILVLSSEIGGFPLIFPEKKKNGTQYSSREKMSLMQVDCYLVLYDVCGIFSVPCAAQHKGELFLYKSVQVIVEYFAPVNA
jgi:hypothetical protein